MLLWTVPGLRVLVSSASATVLACPGTLDPPACGCMRTSRAVLHMRLNQIPVPVAQTLLPLCGSDFVPLSFRDGTAVPTYAVNCVPALKTMKLCIHWTSWNSGTVRQYGFLSGTERQAG